MASGVSISSTSELIKMANLNRILTEKVERQRSEIEKLNEKVYYHEKTSKATEIDC